MSEVQITKQGVIHADGAGSSTSTTKARGRADSAYTYTHTDYTIGFIEIDKTTAKIGDTSIEANQFYEI